nr:v-type atpase assembly factor pkr1 [Quercus suber]
MADFLGNLWESVFTPGTTPTLIIATNATFAALQLLLGALLIATYSIHFVILSILCGGLWYSINWFASELEAARAKEEEASRLRKKSKRDSDWKTKGEVDDSADDEGGNTEVEGESITAKQKIAYKPSSGDKVVREDILDALRTSGKVTQSGVSSGSQLGVGGKLTARQVKNDEADRSGEISTDSEWEQVEGER